MISNTEVSHEEVTDRLCMPTKTKTSSPAILNNLGAKCILEGRHDEALRCLSTALKITKTALVRGKQRRTDTQSQLAKQRSSRVAGQTDTPMESLQRPLQESSHFSSPHAPAQRITPLGQLPARGVRCPRNEDRYDEGVASSTPKNSKQNVYTTKTPTSSYIFADPIFLEERRVCQRHRHCLMKLTAIIAFNLGLVHHLLGRSIITKLEHQDSAAERIMHFERAVAFYTLSCRIQIVEWIVPDQLLAMAQLNNMAQIHDTLGNTKASQRLFERLLSYLVLYTESIRYKDNQEVQRRPLSGFRRNTARFILRDLNVAPAA
jgi:hypothetical protein